jgi:hypothetical protein
VVTICTTILTFNNSTFCPHSVFMCFVLMSEQTAIISLYSINWLVFITETECLLGGTDGSLNIAHGPAIYSYPRLQILQETEESFQIINRPTIKHVISLRKYMEEQFFVGTTFWQKVSFCNPTVQQCGQSQSDECCGIGGNAFSSSICNSG